MTLIGSLPNFCPNASLKLCAGSVETTNTLGLTLASCTDKQHDVVVLPTPPDIYYISY